MISKTLGMLNCKILEVVFEKCCLTLDSFLEAPSQLSIWSFAHYTLALWCYFSFQENEQAQQSTPTTTWFHVSTTPQTCFSYPALLVLMVWKAVSDVWTHRERQGAWLVFIQSLHWQAAPWLLLGSDSLFSQGPSASLTQTLQSHLHCSCGEQRANLQGFLTYGKCRTTDPFEGETQVMLKLAIFVPFESLTWSEMFIYQDQWKKNQRLFNLLFISLAVPYDKNIILVHPVETAWPVHRNFGGRVSQSHGTITHALTTTALEPSWPLIPYIHV